MFLRNRQFGCHWLRAWRVCLAALAVLAVAGICRADVASGHAGFEGTAGVSTESKALRNDSLASAIYDWNHAEEDRTFDVATHRPRTSLAMPVANPLAPVSTADLAGLPNESSAAPAVQALPPPPSSLSIALSGLATFGAIRAIRQAKHIHLGAIPEWYHAEAPDRVGAAVRLDLSTDRGLVPMCWYEPIVSAVAVQYPTCHMRQADDAPRWRSIHFIPTSAPRSPPAGA